MTYAQNGATIQSTRSGNYQVSADDYFARIRRLSDARCEDLRGDEAKLLLRNIAALEELDKDHLGNKPSIRFCKAFDHMCEGYFERN